MKNDNHRDPLEGHTPGLRMSMRRQFVGHRCASPDCNKRFKGLKITKYCSAECRYRAAYLRRMA